MPGERIVVLVPGILGSTLRDNAGGWIWSDNFYQNYKALLANPGLLSWKGVRANAHLLKTARFSFCNLMSLWGAVEGISYPADISRRLYFGYDWRQSNIDSAADLATTLTSVLNLPVSEPPNGNEERRFTFIMHIMGGLVVRIAVAKRLIDPAWIDRLIHIGSPLYGAQAVFNTLFGGGSILPLLSFLVTARRLKNRDAFFDFLQECLQTCPSVYELLPRKQIPYLHYSMIERRNPLNENHLNAEFKGYAINAHTLLDEASAMLKSANVLSFTIHTISHPSRKTEIEFRVNAHSNGYRVIEVTGKTAEGDGTVPRESACGDLTFDKPSPVYGVTHAAMCNDPSVGAILQSIL